MMTKDNLHPRIDWSRGTIFINPGTGSLDEPHSAQQARVNMYQFIMDCTVNFPDDPGFHFRRDTRGDYGNGRYSFNLKADAFPGKTVNIQMPGYALDKVRPEDMDNFDPWNFPRLYVDHSSWLWKYAVLDPEYFQAED